jgi:hypothetical protein
MFHCKMKSGGGAPQSTLFQRHNRITIQINWVTLLIQFRALADQIFCNPDYHKQVRKAVMKQVVYVRLNSWTFCSNINISIDHIAVLIV